MRYRCSTTFRYMAVVSVALLSVVSCGGGGGEITAPPPPPAPVVSQIALSPGSTTLVAGQTQSFTAQPKDAAGNAISGITVGYSIDDPNVASVSLGVVTALKPGTAKLTATSGTVSTSATITVIPAVATITIAPAAPSISIGQTVQLTATLRDAAGGTITGRTVTWTSSSDATASVSSAGLVTAKANGSATITADVEGQKGTAVVEVKPPAVNTVTVDPATIAVDQTLQLKVTLTDASNQPLTGRTITYSSSDPSKVTVNASGLLTGVAVGSATVTATSEGKFGSATISVITKGSPTITALSVSPPTIDVRTGAQTVTVTGKANDGSGTGIKSVTVTAQGHTINSAHGDPTASCSAAAPGGNFSCQFVIPRGAAAGQWPIVSAVVTDNGGGSTTYTATQISTSFGAKFTVTSDEDVTAPMIDSIFVNPNTVDVTTSAQTVTVRVRVRDDLSGVASFTYRATSPSNPATFVECSGTLAAGDSPLYGSWSCSVPIPKGSDPGRWSQTFTVVDAAFNKTAITPGAYLIVVRN